jgi:hypothetical protein
MSKLTFQGCVPTIFLTQEQQDQRILDGVERRRQAREDALIIISRDAALQDSLEASTQQWQKYCQQTDAACIAPSTADYAAALINTPEEVRGLKLAWIGGDRAARLAFKSLATELKAEMRLTIVAPMEKAVADFQKANRAVLARIPKLVKTKEPPFVPAPPDDGEKELRLPNVVKSMLGLKRDERAFAGYEPPSNGNSPYPIRDLDND